MAYDRGKGFNEHWVPPTWFAPVDYDQIASKGVLQEAISVLAQVQLMGPAAVMSWNGLSTTSTKFKKKKKNWKTQTDLNKGMIGSREWEV